MVEHQSKDYSRSRTAPSEKPYLNPAGSLAKIINLAKHRERILDIGCADGSLGQYLKEFDCHVTGVDISDDMINVANKYCDESYVIDLDNSDISDTLKNKFDVIVCADVLEHLKDPGRALLQIKSLLKDDGFIIASIPNIAHGSVRLSLLQGKFDYQDLGILDNTHLRFFTRKSVISLFENVGYSAQIIDVTEYPIFRGELVPLVKRKYFSEELIEQVKASSDSEVLQFIVKAVPERIVSKALNEDYEDDELQEKYAGTYVISSIMHSQIEKLEGTAENQLQVVKVQLRNLKNEYDATQTRLEKTLSERIDLQRQLEIAKDQLEHTQSKLQKTENKVEKISEDLNLARLTIEEMKAAVVWQLQMRIDRLRNWLYANFKQ